MRLRNERTGDTLEFPSPDRNGQSVVTLNGQKLLTATLYDEPSRIVTEHGDSFTPDEFSDYLVELLAQKLTPKRGG